MKFAENNTVNPVKINKAIIKAQGDIVSTKTLSNGNLTFFCKNVQTKNRQ